MSHHKEQTATGTIVHVFGHRFVLKTGMGHLLADLTPHGAEKVRLRVGDEASLAGEMKPTELKVFAFTSGGKTVRIEHGPKHHPHGHHHHDHHDAADPAVAVDAAKAAGYAVVAEPRRKPKHFEVLGRRNGKLSELHIELDGHIRKVKSVEADDHKWAGLAEARP